MTGFALGSVGSARSSADSALSSADSALSLGHWIRLSLCLTVIALAFFWSTTALAQSYPTRPITLIVPYPAGGATDVTARVIAAEMSKHLQQKVIVENKPGAVGTVGAGFVAKQPPDGYTLLLGGPGNLTLRPLMQPPLSYDPLRDLATVNHVANYDHLLVVRNGLGVNSVTELIALAKSKPGALTFGSSGTGGPQHMAVELFMLMAGIEMKHIPYKGEAPVVTDLGGERIDVSIITATAIGSFVKEGRVKALAATNPYRSNTFKNLPTVFEAGLPGYEFESYGGIMAPAGTPKAVIDTLNGAIAKAVASPELQQKFLDANLFLLGKGPEEFSKFLAAERLKWAPIIKKAGATDAS